MKQQVGLCVVFAVPRSILEMRVETRLYVIVPVIL